VLPIMHFRFNLPGYKNEDYLKQWGTYRNWNNNWIIRLFYYIFASLYFFGGISIGIHSVFKMWRLSYEVSKSNKRLKIFLWNLTPFNQLLLLPKNFLKCSKISGY
jgi:hypothetical protein